MQAATATFSPRNSPAKSAAQPSTEKYERSISVPLHLYRKLEDFLEDRWGVKIARRKNAFYTATQPDQPIAWLNSQETVTIVLIDHTSGRRNMIQIRIEDIQLPTPIRVEYRIYRSLLYHLIRSSNGGVVRWYNKFYATRTGMVLAELVSPQKIKLFHLQGLFGISSQVDLKDYAAIEVQREQYIHLLNFLEQEEGDEVARVGNAFYSKEVSETLRTVLKSPATVEMDSVLLMSTKLLAELVSQDTVRLSDDTTTRISELVLTRRVYRNHLYFCSSCQSFIRIPYKATVHERLSDIHALTYVSSNLVVVPVSKRGTHRNEKKEFPEILNRFWGMEKGKVTKEGTRKISKKQPLLPHIPRAGTTRVAKQRPVSTDMLLLLADITVDGHVVTNGEKSMALHRLQSEEDRVEELSLLEGHKEGPAEKTTREEPGPVDIKRKVKGLEIKESLHREVSEIAELNIETLPFK